MSAIDLAALVVIIVAFAAFVVLWSTVGRLRRTGDFLGTTTFGSSEAAEQACATVRAIHERVYFRPLLEAFAESDGALTDEAVDTRLAAFGFARRRFGASAATLGAASVLAAATLRRGFGLAAGAASAAISALAVIQCASARSAGRPSRSQIMWARSRMRCSSSVIILASKGVFVQCGPGMGHRVLPKLAPECNCRLPCAICRKAPGVRFVARRKSRWKCAWSA